MRVFKIGNLRRVRRRGILPAVLQVDLRNPIRFKGVGRFKRLNLFNTISIFWVSRKTDKQYRKAK